MRLLGFLGCLRIDKPLSGWSVLLWPGPKGEDQINCPGRETELPPARAFTAKAGIVR